MVELPILKPRDFPITDELILDYCKRLHAEGLTRNMTLVGRDWQLNQDDARMKLIVLQAQGKLGETGASLRQNSRGWTLE